MYVRHGPGKLSCGTTSAVMGAGERNLFSRDRGEGIIACDGDGNLVP